MRLPGSLSIRRTLRQLRSRLRNGIAILGYHRVSEARTDPLGLSTAPENFDAHVLAAARLGRILSLGEAAAAIGTGRVPERGVVFTFDDGYSDNLHTVLPMLERHRIPATMFVTSGNRGGEFWWDRLARLLAASGRAAETEPLAVELERVPSEARERQIDALASNATRASEPVYRALTGDELKRLAASPLVEIGAHTESHRRLTDLQASAQRDETSRSRADLETLLGRPVTSFAYPHGAIDAQAIASVRGAGYQVACCSKADVAARGSSLLALPRLWPGDRSGPAFERWLRSWLHG